MIHRANLLLELDFVGLNNGRLDFWTRADCIGWSERCALGRRRAEQAIAFMKKYDDPLLLAKIADARSAKGIRDAVQIGYAQRIAEFILTGR